MSGRKNVESDRMLVLRAYRDTKGMSDPERSIFWLEKLTKAEFRGRGDTLSAARDRAVIRSGAPISKAKRLWDRWATMKTVAGDLMIPLMLAYEDYCERIEEKADAFRDERIQIQGGSHEDDCSPDGARMGMGGAETGAVR